MRFLTSLALFCQVLRLQARHEIIYVQNHHMYTCDDVCESKDLKCDDDVMDMMDCPTAAMKYCQNEELTSYKLQERETCKFHECLVDCGQGYYSDHGSTSSRCVDQKSCAVTNNNFQAICPCVMHISTYHSVLTIPWVGGGLLALFLSLLALLVYKGYRVFRKKNSGEKTYKALSSDSSHSTVSANNQNRNVEDIELNIEENAEKSDAKQEKTENLVQKYVRTRSGNDSRSSNDSPRTSLRVERYKRSERTTEAATLNAEDASSQRPRRYIRRHGRSETGGHQNSY